MHDAITIHRPPADVFAFMTDPRHEREWNPQLLGVERLTAGPIGVGSRFRMRFGHGVGDSTVTFLAYDAPRRWAASSTSRLLDVRLDGAVRPAGTRAQLVLSTQLLPHGPLRPLVPVLRRYMHRTWDRNLAAIEEQLERPEKGEPDASRNRVREPVRQHP